MNTEKLKTIGSIVFVVGVLLLLVTIFILEKRQRATLETQFDAIVQKVFDERKAAADWRRSQVEGSTGSADATEIAEVKEFKVGKILPILIRDGKAKLSAEVLQNLPQDRRPSTPEEVQTLLIIEHLGSYETAPVRGITTYHSSTVQDFEYVLVDISHPQFESPRERAGSAATLVEEVPVEEITTFVGAMQSFKASRSVEHSNQ